MCVCEWRKIVKAAGFNFRSLVLQHCTRATKLKIMFTSSVIYFCVVTGAHGEGVVQDGEAYPTPEKYMTR